MRLLIVPVLALATATPALAIDLPARKPGLWELKMTMEGRKLPPQTLQHCIDAATDKEMNTIGANKSAERCAKQDVQRSGSTITIDSVCALGQGTSTSHAVVNGSFDSAYTVKVTSRREGGPAIPKMPAETNMTIEATWLGACKPDQKPGDMIMGNGMKMNVRDLPRGMPKP
jgi:hypothetical protein